MADKIFHTWFVEKVAPVWADKIMLSDSEATNQTKFTDIANLPVSTPTSTAIWVVQSDINAHEARTDNPHSVTKAQVGLSDVDNTSDATKNTAVATLTNKTLTSPVINSPTGIVKGDVWLGNVDNTSDVDKPISTATQTALDWKQDTLTGLTATPTELNILDGATLSTTELNYVDGVTSNIQTQLDTKSSLTQIQDNTKQDLSLALTPNYDAINGAIVLDSSKNHYHWTVSGATYVPNGWLNGWWAYGFDGVDDYIELNDGMTIDSLVVSGGWETVPAWLFVSPDGVYAYVTGNAIDSIEQYTMSIPWKISSATLTRTFYVWATVVNPWTLAFSTDGTKMYLSNSGSGLYQYNLWTAWDISTAVYLGTYSTVAQTSALRWIAIKPDGTKFYVVDNAVTDTAYQYSMTGGDITTWSYDSKSKVVSTEDTACQGIAFNDIGTKMFILGDTGNDVNEYSLSTAWDISTATTTWITFYVWGEQLNPYDLCFSWDGTKLYICWDTWDKINQYNLYSPYSFSNPIYSNGFTIIADIKADSAGETTGRIFDKTNSTGWGWFPIYMSTTNRVATFVDAATSIAQSNNNSIVYWEKQRVAVIYSWTTASFYINWVAAWSGTVNALTRITTPRNMVIWNTLATDRTFDWYIWQVRIISRVLTATEIANDYLQRTEIDNPPEVPRLTTAMRDVMTPELWQPIYNTTTNKSQVYNGTWNDLY